MRKPIIQRIHIVLLIVILLFNITSVVFAEVELPFTDVLESHWYYEDVCFAYEQGLMLGVKADKFDPEGSVTRAMVATIFWRMQDSPVQEKPCSFTDVASGVWYSDAIAWAEASEIVNGIGGGKFAPNAYITREDLMTMFYRYADYSGRNMPKEYHFSTLQYFKDRLQLSYYAITPMEWALTEGLIYGESVTQLNPSALATRAQLSAILHRFLETTDTKLIGISVSQLPDKTDYRPGEALDLTGLEIAAFYETFYEGGSSVFCERISDYQLSIPEIIGGPNQIIVAYCGFRTQFIIMVTSSGAYYDIDAAMEAGNNYALSIGFSSIDYSLTPSNAGYFPYETVTGKILTMAGGQAWLEQEMRDSAQSTKDNLVGMYGEDGHVLPCRTYIAYDAATDTYFLYFLYD